MNLKTLCFTFLIILGVTLCGCHKTTYRLSEGTYSAHKSAADFVEPFITFDLAEDRFIFSYDPLSSYLPTGTIRIADGKVTATTDDEEYTYVFALKDNDTIAFIQKDSSAITMTQGEPSVVDGTEFKFSGGK